MTYDEILHLLRPVSGQRVRLSNRCGSLVGLCEVGPIGIGGRSDPVVWMDGQWRGGEIENFDTFEVMGPNGRYATIGPAAGGGS